MTRSRERGAADPNGGECDVVNLSLLWYLPPESRYRALFQKVITYARRWRQAKHRRGTAQIRPVSVPAPSAVAYHDGMAGYRSQASDTTEQIDRFVFDGLRRMTPGERLRLAAEASIALEQLAIAALRDEFPDASEEELRRRAGAIRLGPDLTRRAFGDAAEAWLT